MSEEHLGIESLPSTYEQAVELFRRVRDLKAGVVVEIEPTQSGDSLLLLRVEIPQRTRMFSRILFALSELIRATLFVWRARFCARSIR